MKWRCLLGVVLAFVLVTPIAATADAYSDIHVLGDSLSDQGNLFQATLSLTGSGIPASDHYYLGRFANGEIYAELLAKRLGLTLAATAFGGKNYAYGGARTNYNIVEDPPTAGGFPPGLFPWTLNLERQAFVASGVNDPGALYVVFSGSNDIADLIGRTLVLGFAATKPASDQVVEGVRRVIEAFIAAGARDILVPNVPDLGLVPLVFTRDPLPGQPPGSHLVATTATALAIRYNTALEAMLQQFIGVNIVRFDTFSFLRRAVSDPAALGLTNVTQPCYTGFVEPAEPTDTVCSTPETYLFWDAEHPSTVAHARLAEEMLVALRMATLSYLQGLVNELAGESVIQAALQDKLDDATEVLLDADPGNDHAAINIVQAFINQVEAQRGKKISEPAAAELIRRAQQLIELLRA